MARLPSKLLFGLIMTISSNVFAEDSTVENLGENASPYENCPAFLSQETRISQLEQMVLAQQLSINTLMGRVGQIPSQLGPIAFTAAMSPSNGQDVTINADTHLPYNKVMINQGSGYDSTRFEFVCPIDGLYAFTASVMNTGSGTDCNLGFMKDGIEIGRFRPHAAANNMGSNFFLVHCQQHEAVWVEIRNKNSCQFYTNYNYNTFSGFRLGPYQA